MCAAALTFVFASCDKKDKPTGGDDPEEQFTSIISVKDGSIADWNNVPADYLFETVRPDGASLMGLKSIKVYADYLYINLLVEYDENDITDLESVPFHVYLNTDNSDLTGGYKDQFTDANADILLEGGIYGLEEGLAEYNPGVFKWWGEVGGEGWQWSDPEIEPDESNLWGAIVAEGALPIGSSQLVNGKVEIQLMRALIPTDDAPWNTTEFGIGFDIQQSWTSVGVLPLVDATEENPNGYAHKLQVKINPAK